MAEHIIDATATGVVVDPEFQKALAEQAARDSANRRATLRAQERERRLHHLMEPGRLLTPSREKGIELGEAKLRDYQTKSHGRLKNVAIPFETKLAVLEGQRDRLKAQVYASDRARILAEWQAAVRGEQMQIEREQLTMYRELLATAERQQPEPITDQEYRVLKNARDLIDVSADAAVDALEEIVNAPQCSAALARQVHVTARILQKQPLDEQGVAHSRLGLVLDAAEERFESMWDVAADVIGAVMDRLPGQLALVAASLIPTDDGRMPPLAVKGLDIAVPDSTPVVAPDDGIRRHPGLAQLDAARGVSGVGLGVLDPAVANALQAQRDAATP